MRIGKGEFLCLRAAAGTRMGVREKPVPREMPREARISRPTASSQELNCLARPPLGQPGAGQTLASLWAVRRQLQAMSGRFIVSPVDQDLWLGKAAIIRIIGS